MAKKNAGGPGKKQCPNCSEYVGVRSQTCPKCQHEFPKKAAKKTPKATAVQQDLFGDEIPASVKKARELAAQYTKRVEIIEKMAKLDQQKKDLKPELDELNKQLGI